MSSPIPPRDRTVYLVGAGLSSTFGLPNTPSLISETIAFAKNVAWLQNENLDGTLRRAFKFFYPDALHAGFQPDVVDFFSTLRTYLDVGAGLVGTGFADAPETYRLLRRAIAHVLVDRIRSIDGDDLCEHPFLAEMVQPGNIIITTNWDLLIEHYAQVRGIPLRLTSSSRQFPSSEVFLLKLHGSIDWCQVGARKPNYDDENFAALRELQFGRQYTLALPAGTEALVRIRATPVNTAWQKIRSRATEPYIVTMATGKADDLGPLQEVWRDAYRALSRAQRVEIVGYSMPPDDIEIRTILRTGIQRGSSSPTIVVKNPAPDVHNRVRAFLDRRARSDYLPVPGC